MITVPKMFFRPAVATQMTGIAAADKPIDDGVIYDPHRV